MRNGFNWILGAFLVYSYLLVEFFETTQASFTSFPTVTDEAEGVFNDAHKYTEGSRMCFFIRLRRCWMARGPLPRKTALMKHPIKPSLKVFLCMFEIKEHWSYVINWTTITWQFTSLRVKVNLLWVCPSSRCPLFKIAQHFIGQFSRCQSNFVFVC